MMKKALIIGISGQDGAYLARFLLGKGYHVYGTSRDAQVSLFSNLQRLSVIDQVETLSMAINDFRSVLQVLRDVEPDEIYNLSGQTSVGLSFEQPVEAMESISVGTLNILEGIRFLGRPVKFYNASSSECFGNTAPNGASEVTPFHPCSPYAVAKSSAFWIVANYRDAYNLYVCNGILFNHESPLRPFRFVTQKIVSTACDIAQGVKQKLVLGNIEIKRDWGWAPEYVEAMWRMLQLDKASDFVIATGKSYSLKDFVEVIFNYLDLDYNKYISINENLKRPTDINYSCGNPEKARMVLDWSPQYSMKEVAKAMVEAEMSARSKASFQ